MKALYYTSSLLALVATLAIVVFEDQQNKVGVLLSAGGVFIFGIIAFVCQQAMASKDKKDFDRVNAELQGHITGGDNNRPFVIISFIEQPDNSFESRFMVYNFGKFPMSSVTFEIHDHHSTYQKFYKETGLEFGKMSEAEILQLNNYLQDNRAEFRKHGTIANLPSNVGTLMSSGAVDKFTSVLTYNITIHWNNQLYSAIYELEYLPDYKTFSPYSIRVTGKDGPVTDLKKYFPLVPEEVWGGFPTLVDHTPTLRQAEARKDN